MTVLVVWISGPVGCNYPAEQSHDFEIHADGDVAPVDVRALELMARPAGEAYPCEYIVHFFPTEEDGVSLEPIVSSIAPNDGSGSFIISADEPAMSVTYRARLST